MQFRIRWFITRKDFFVMVQSWHTMILFTLLTNVLYIPNKKLIILQGSRSIWIGLLGLSMQRNAIQYNTDYKRVTIIWNSLKNYKVGSSLCVGISYESCDRSGKSFV